jgi:hypothetical protein
LWDGDLPAPLVYAGYRRPNGVVHARTVRPTALPNQTPYEPKPFVNLYEELYGAEERRRAAVEAEIRRIAMEEQQSWEAAEAEHAKGFYTDDVKPMFQTVSGAQRRFTKEREDGRLAMLMTPPAKRSARDAEKLPGTFHESIVDSVIEYAALTDCTVSRSLLVGCHVKGGRFTSCGFESCVLHSGVEILQPTSLRCCELQRCRVTEGYPTNCRVQGSALRDCPHIAQCTLNDTELRRSLVIHSFLRECQLDSTVDDAGANVFELCNFVKEEQLSYAEKMLNL